MMQWLYIEWFPAALPEQYLRMRRIVLVDG